ncbi:hypothetical protein LIER_03866 [Lithospermum erythrorhizon]|uniref:Uncharacterized protein n=1 Tax=Lithospermum erythrorhizon TaxID=34254 RepID=A0AAV3NUR2_LITER
MGQSSTQTQGQQERNKRPIRGYVEEEKEPQQIVEEAENDEVEEVGSGDTNTRQARRASGKSSYEHLSTLLPLCLSQGD